MPEVLTLRKSNCKNCHKCIRYCPAKAIRFTGHQAQIIHDECILCGRCYVVCPQDAKRIADSKETVKVLIQSGAYTVASIDPAFVAGFEGAGIETMREALMQLGFSEVEETAVAATKVKREYEKMIADGERDIIITSSCPSINRLIQRHYPELCSRLAPVMTPMAAHAKDIKKQRPDAKVVFITSCLAAKDEIESSQVDAVLTFLELAEMLEEKEIKIERKSDENPGGRTRLFSIVGGIIKSMDFANTDYTCLSLDGAKDCRSALDDIATGELHHCFIEMSACEGGCINGPVMEKYDNYPVRHYQMVSRYAGTKDFDVPQAEKGELYASYESQAVTKKMPSDEEIRKILKTIGKNRQEDELNCGTCGYDTCREKAIAIFQGQADYSMCLPFIMDRTQRFSNNILDNSPNGIVVINDNFEIQQLNRTAMRMMNIEYQSDVMGENIIRILDPTPFYQVYESGKTVKNRRAYFSDYRKYFEQTIVLDKDSHTLMCILRDVTDEEEAHRKKDELAHTTVQIADKVVEKQMRIVQQIASLLGETAAETKVALTKLKETIEDEDE